MEKVFHITWTTFNSRVSERMKLYKVKPKGDGIYLDDLQEFEISNILGKIIKELKLKVFAYNICKDHIHLLIQCDEKDLSLIMRKLKGKSVKMYKDLYKIEDKIHFWGQKYNKNIIDNKKQFFNTIKYIKNNRKKHGLKENNLLNKINFITKII